MAGKEVLDDVNMDTSGHIQILQTNATDTDVEEQAEAKTIFSTIRIAI